VPGVQQAAMSAPGAFSGGDLSDSEDVLDAALGYAAAAQVPIETPSFADCFNGGAGVRPAGAGAGWPHAALAEDEYDSVVVVDDLRKRRRREGYQADDGTTQLRGGEGDRDALYGEEWLKERLTRQRLLDGNRHYQFAVKVAANSNLPLREFTNEAEIQRATVARIRDAARRLADLRRTQRDRESAPTSIDAQEKRVDDADRALLATTSGAADLESARQCFLGELREAAPLASAVLAPFALVDVGAGAVDVDFARALFVYVTRAAVALEGPLGYARADQRTKNTVVAVANELLAARAPPPGMPAAAPVQRQRVADDMPRSAYVALYESLLLYASERDGLLRALADRTDLFAPAAEYSQTPRLYAEDCVTLANLLFESGTDNLLLFDNVSFLLYAHLNKMRRRAALDDEAELRRPQLPPGVGGGGNGGRRRNGGRRKLDGVDIVFDLGDEELEAVADGEPQRAFSQDELRRIQSLRGANQSQSDTLVLVERLLAPLFETLAPRLFYRTDAATADAGADYEAFAGGVERGVVQEVAVGERNAPLASAVLVNAARIVQLSAAGSRLADADLDAAEPSFELQLRSIGVDPVLLGAVRDAVLENFRVTDAQRRDYQRRALNRLLRTSSVLRCFARYAALRAALQLPIEALSGDKLAQLRRYATESAKPEARLGGTHSQEFAAIEDDAYAALSETLLGAPRPSDAAMRQPLLFTRSQRRFYDLLLANLTVVDGRQRDVAGVLRERTDRQREEAAEARRLLERLRQLRSERIDDDEQEAEETLASVLQREYVPTAESALSPLNSGVLFYSDLMMGALAEAYDILGEAVPCLAHAHGSYRALIESDRYWTRFATLVQAAVRLIDARNPVTYRPVVNETRSRGQVRSALDRLRDLAADDRALRHGCRCSCFLNRRGVAGTAACLPGAGPTLRYFAAPASGTF